MKKMVKGWVHTPGIHCGSVAIRDVMAYWGFDLSEAMCFGLGSGMGFFYIVTADFSPTRMIFMRGPGMEHIFFNLLGKNTRWKYADDPEEALNTSKQHIDNNIPILIQSDIFHLDYYDSSTHFPGHVIGLWGYNDETEMFYVSDTGFEELQTVSYENLKRARTSDTPQFPLKNNWFEVDLRHPIPPLPEVIPEAVRTNARMMLEGASSPRGTSSVEQIKLWSEDLPGWPEALDWKWCARFGYQVIVKRGVDGAGFRRMYRDFLREAEEIVPELKTLKLSQKMDAIGAGWVETAGVLKQISEGDTPDTKLLKKASSLSRELWEMEGEYYSTALEKVTGGLSRSISEGGAA